MIVVAMLAEALGMVAGSLAMAVFLCWFCWRLAKIVHHPAWGPPIVVPVLLALAGLLPASQFLDMTLAFAVVFAIPFWIEGRAWRRRHLNRHKPVGTPPVTAHKDPAETPISFLEPQRRYPAIAACIGAARSPDRDEMKLVATRIWREGFGSRYPVASFAARRRLIRAARGALVGD
ncbi:MAG: hypothetical protein ABI240_05735 [Sphingomonas sp.]